MAMPLLSEDQLLTLVKEIADRVKAFVPGWTEVRDEDPGVTLIELFSWLTDELLYRSHWVSERARTEILKTIRNLERLSRLTSSESEDLTRVRYFADQLLAAEDFQTE